MCTHSLTFNAWNLKYHLKTFIAQFQILNWYQELLCTLKFRVFLQYILVTWVTRNWSLNSCSSQFRNAIGLSLKYTLPQVFLNILPFNLSVTLRRFQWARVTLFYQEVVFAQDKSYKWLLIQNQKAQGRQSDIMIFISPFW